MTNHENEVPASFFQIVILLAAFAACAEGLPAQHDLPEKLDHAQTLARRGEATAAEREYLAVIQLDPESYEAHNDLGALYMGEKRYESACHEFTQAAHLNPRVAAIHQNLGICFIAANNFAKAAEALKKAEELDPQDLRTRYFLGYSLFTLNRDEAKAELEFVLAHKPDDENTLFYLIRIYTRRKDYGKATDAFRELSKAHPNSVFVHILAGESYDLQERVKDAIEEFKKAVALAPEMRRLHFDLGFLYWEDQRFEEAAVEFTEELRLNLHFAPADYYLGDIAANRSDYVRAKEFFKRARTESPGCLDAYLGLGKTYARMEQWQEALQEFQLANKIDGGQSDVHYWLGTTFRHLGHQDESLREMRTYREIVSKRKKTLVPAEEVPRERWTARSCMPDSY